MRTYRPKKKGPERDEPIARTSSRSPGSFSPLRSVGVLVVSVLVCVLLVSFFSRSQNASLSSVPGETDKSASEDFGSDVLAAVRTSDATDEEKGSFGLGGGQKVESDKEVIVEDKVESTEQDGGVTEQENDDQGKVNEDQEKVKEDQPGAELAGRALKAVEKGADEKGRGRGREKPKKKKRSRVLQKAEDKFQENMNKRSREFKDGERPKNPYGGWKTGRIKRVFFRSMYPCPKEERIGNEKDGGKWVCNLDSFAGKSPVIYSIGSKGDVSFEKTMFDRLKVKSFTFDPYLDKRVAQSVTASSFLSFYPYGIYSKREAAQKKIQEKNGMFMTVQEVMSQLGHKYVDIFKIDCERCEETLFPELLRLYGRKKVPFGQVLVEIHQTINAKRTFKVLFALEDMGYRLFHAESNDRCSACYELAFIHESLC